jgi:hypothetical protein
MQIPVVWDMTPCRSVTCSNISEQNAASIVRVVEEVRFYPTNEGNKLLRHAWYINIVVRSILFQDNGNFIRMAVRTSNLVHLSYWHR